MEITTKKALESEQGIKQLLEAKIPSYDVASRIIDVAEEVSEQLRGVAKKLQYIQIERVALNAKLASEDVSVSGPALDEAKSLVDKEDELLYALIVVPEPCIAVSEIKNLSDLTGTAIKSIYPWIKK